MIRSIDCLASTGTDGTITRVAIASLLLIFAGIAIRISNKKSVTRLNGYVAIFLFIGVAAIMFIGSTNRANANSDNCPPTTSVAAPVQSPTQVASPSATPTPSSSVTPTPSPTPTQSPDPTFTDGLTLIFTPQANPQYMWYCPNNGSSVCSSSPTRTLTNTSFTANAINGKEFVNIPLATFTTENSGGYFAVTVKAPGSTANWEKIGPGAGITCLQRTSTVTGTSSGTGTSFNNVSKGDWTGAGTINSVQQYNFWFNRCSFDSGVTYAEFYGILK